jgi:UDP-N-acetylmuramoyl-tripeptide--D-alanyl-D-alanine ligase
VLRLIDVLYGVQPRSTRQLPVVPAQWEQATLGEAVTDSREVEPGALFVALSGERTDGHNFLADVIDGGAAAALVNRKAAEQRRERLAQSARPWAIVDPASGAELATLAPDTCLLIAVDDPLMALQRLAVYHRRKLAPTVVGITGSVGKTSTKEVTAAVLSRRFRTLKSKRSFNSEATLPTSLLRLTPDHDVAVLEMGMWAPGEIRFLANLARPQIGIVTNVGPSHLERMGSIDAISNAKAELPESLPSEGYAILNADDPRVLAMAARTQAQVITYGLTPEADIWADEVVSHGLEGISLRIHQGNESVMMRLPLIGRHSAHLALAATAAGRALGMGWDEIITGLQSDQSQLRLFTVPSINDALLIDDTYNAAPISTLAALNLLDDLGGRKIAVLGDMLELGAVEEEGHRKVGARAAEVVDLLVTVGPRARWIAAEALAAGLDAQCVIALDSNEAAIRTLAPVLQIGDYVLVKGSRGVAMEQIVAALQRRTREGEN